MVSRDTSRATVRIAPKELVGHECFSVVDEVVRAAVVVEVLMEEVRLIFPSKFVPS